MTSVLTTSDPAPVLPPYKLALLARPCRVCGDRLESLSKGRSYCSDDCRASWRQESGASRWWTPEHDAVVTQMYAFQDRPIEDIAAAVGRTAVSVLVRTSTLGIKRPKVPRSPAGSLENLLDESPEAAYWVGFILADGYISDRNRLKVTLKATDHSHLEQLAHFLGSSSTIRPDKGGSASTFTLMDSVNVPLIRDRFDILPRKTYNPPSRLPYTDEDLLRSFLIGFIDGDGNIRRQTGRRTSAIRTVSHLSWTPFLEDMTLRLQLGGVITRSGSVGGTGTYAEWHSMRHDENVSLKEFAADRGLPVLARKWDRIDGSFSADRYRKAEEMRELIRKGKPIKEIANLLGRTEGAVYKARRLMRSHPSGDAFKGVRTHSGHD